MTPRKIPGYGVTVSLPPDWVGSKPPAEVASFGVKYLYRAPEATSGFHPNLNLVVSPIPAGVTLRQWLFSGASAAFQYAGKTTAVSINGVAGLHYVSTKATRFGTKPLLTDEYAFVRKGQVFLLTYSALASTRARYEPVFSASAETIRFSANPLGRASA
jgi:hypothetical protein